MPQMQISISPIGPDNVCKNCTHWHPEATRKMLVDPNSGSLFPADAAKQMGLDPIQQATMPWCIMAPCTLLPEWKQAPDFHFCSKFEYRLQS